MFFAIKTTSNSKEIKQTVIKLKTKGTDLWVEGKIQGIKKTIQKPILIMLSAENNKPAYFGHFIKSQRKPIKFRIFKNIRKA